MRPAGPVHAGAFVAFADIAPVEHEDAAVGEPVTDFHAAEPRIGLRTKKSDPCLPT